MSIVEGYYQELTGSGPPKPEPKEDSLDVEGAMLELRHLTYRLYHPQMALYEGVYQFLMRPDVIAVLERFGAAKHQEGFEEGVEWAKENYQPAMGTRE